MGSALDMLCPRHGAALTTCRPYNQHGYGILYLYLYQNECLPLCIRYLYALGACTYWVLVCTGFLYVELISCRQESFKVLFCFALFQNCLWFCRGAVCFCAQKVCAVCATTREGLHLPAEKVSFNFSHRSSTKCLHLHDSSLGILRKWSRYIFRYCLQ